MNAEQTVPQKAQDKRIGWILLAVAAVSIAYFAIYKVWAGEVKMDTQTAFLLMLLCLVIGEVLSTKTKAFVPSMFISAVLFVAGFWTFFPKDILQVGGVAPNLPTFLVMMMVVHLGSMLDIKELVAQWKTVLITLAGMLGILVVVLTAGVFLLDQQTAAIAAPPLTGGFVAALMMQSVAGENQHLFILAMAIYVLQGFVGYPLTSICLKMEGNRVLKLYRAGTWNPDSDAGVTIKKPEVNFTRNIFPQVPAKYKSDFTYLLSMVVVVVLSGYLEILSAGYMSKFVWALVLGVFATAFGFTEDKTLLRARSMGFVYTLIMMFVFSQLSSVTPTTLVALLKDFAVLITLAALGVAVLSIPVGRYLGMSVPMSFTLGLGTLAGGFPASYTLSVEAANVLAENEAEYKLLEQHMLPKTLVAGFVSATSGSVFVAGVVISLYFK